MVICTYIFLNESFFEDLTLQLLIVVDVTFTCSVLFLHLSFSCIAVLTLLHISMELLMNILWEKCKCRTSLILLIVLASVICLFKSSYSKIDII